MLNQFTIECLFCFSSIINQPSGCSRFHGLYCESLMENFTAIRYEKMDARRTFASSNFGTIYNGRTLWIGCQTALCVMTILLFYVICCLARYAERLYRATNNTRKHAAQASVERATNTCDDLNCNANITPKSRNKHRRIMVYICLLASVATLVKCLADQFAFFYAWKARDDAVCEMVYDGTNNALFSVAFLSVYSFLWMKQWVLYRDPAVIGILYNKRLVLFSNVLGAVVLVLGAANLIMNLVPTRFKAGYSYAEPNDIQSLMNDDTYIGCVSTYTYFDEDQVFPLMSYVMITTIFQITLVVLFLYPFLRQKLDLMKLSKRRKRASRKIAKAVEASMLLEPEPTTKTDCDDMNENSTSSSRRDTDTSSAHDLYAAKMFTPSAEAMRPIKRAVICSSVCVLTDSTLFAIFASLGRGTPLILTSVAQNIVLFVNIICLVMTYNPWRCILFPLCMSTTVDMKTQTLKKVARKSFNNNSSV